MTRALVIAIALAACGGGGSSSPDANPSTPDAGDPGACDERDRIAHVRVAPDSGASGMYGQVFGWVVDGRIPEVVTTTDAAGGCRFVAPQPVLCTPACTGNEVCDVHGQCVTYPAYLDVGAMRITGTTPAVTMTPQPGNSYYPGTTYPDLYGPGDTIVLDIDGGSGVAPIHLETMGVPVMTIPDETLTATEHQDFVVAYDPITGVDDAVITVVLRNDHHAGPEYVECTADAGAGQVTVPAAILDQLIVAGEAGIGTYIESATIEVRRRASVTIPGGCAAFDSASDLFFFVDTVRVP